MLSAYMPVPHIGQTPHLIHFDLRQPCTGLLSFAFSTNHLLHQSQWMRYTLDCLDMLFMISDRKDQVQHMTEKVQSTEEHLRLKDHVKACKDLSISVCNSSLCRFLKDLYGLSSAQSSVFPLANQVAASVKSPELD